MAPIRDEVMPARAWPDGRRRRDRLDRETTLTRTRARGGQPAAVAAGRVRVGGRRSRRIGPAGRRQPGARRRLTHAGGDRQAGSSPRPAGPTRPSASRAAVDFIVQLHQLAGPPEEAFGRIGALLGEHELDPSPLREIERALALLPSYGITQPEVTVDLSLGRGLRYYTGLVFELHAGARRRRGQSARRGWPVRRPGAGPGRARPACRPAASASGWSG